LPIVADGLGCLVKGLNKTVRLFDNSLMKRSRFAFSLVSQTSIVDLVGFEQTFDAVCSEDYRGQQRAKEQQGE
jgi:hypothetical protein